MAETTSYDLIVIGGGPGGYVAAIRAAQLGQKVAVVERDNLGGVCLNWGCIPTKSLLRNAELASILTGEAKEFGFSFDNLKLDYSVAQKRSRQVSDRLVKGVGFLFKKNNITHVQGTATLIGPKKVKVEPSGQVLDAKNIIIATGARPRSLPGMTVDGQKIITYRQALELTVAPKRLVVVGAGAIGMEFAYVFRSYGAEVTVIEMLPHVLPLEDDETATEVARAFKKQGIKTFVNTRTEGVDVTADGVTVRVKDQASGAASGGTGDRSRRGARRDRHRAQQRRHRAGGCRRADRQARLHPGQRNHADQCRRRLRHRRRDGQAGAGACRERPGHRRGRASGRARDAADQGRRLCVHAALHLLQAAGRQPGLHRGAGEGEGLRGQGQQVPLHRQR